MMFHDWCEFVMGVFPSAIDQPFYLNLHACSIEWCMQFAGSMGERVSWVAGGALSCISLVLVAVKTSHFTATRWPVKDHCHVTRYTTGQIKVTAR